MVLHVDFRELLKGHEDVTRCLLEDEVDCVPVNYPYSLNNELGIDDPSHDVVPPEGMRDFCGVGPSNNAVGQTDMFPFRRCSIPIGIGGRRLCTKKCQKVEADSRVEVTMSRKIFKEESIPLHYTPAMRSC